MAPLKSDLPYTIRRSARARRVRVTVGAGGEVVVTLPKRPPSAAPPRRCASCGRGSTAAGRLWRAPPRRSPASPARCRTWARRCGWSPSRAASGSTAAATRCWCPPGDATEAIERFYRRRARAEIGPRLDAATARAGTTYNGLTIRGQRTRWASCSSNGAMSFNWRLLLAPEAVLDYVIEHEVCHLEVMDHSPRFWALLESRVPGWREHAAWLRRYGSTLVL